MADHPERISLHRVYSSGRTCWACTIQADEEVPAGFRVIDHDPNVADSVFLIRLEQHMRSPAEGSFCEEREGGIIVSGVETLYPGEPAHFGTAARTVPFAHVGPSPENDSR